MDQERFLETKSWAEQRGLKLFPHMEHKQVDGIWGMYATEAIPRFTVLARYPIDANLPINNTFSYPDNTQEVIKRIHSATLEYSKKSDSEWSGLMNSVESLEQLKQTSAYFLSDSEMTSLSMMNQLLHRIIQEKNAIVSRQVTEICQFDPSISRDDALCIALNFKTRAWSRGFLPIFDQFNTSEALGAKVWESDSEIFFMALKDYQPGEEIWISYGRRDMYDYAIDYDFFDPKAAHSINFAARGSQFTSTPLDEEIVRYAATKHAMDISEVQNGLHYQLEEDDARILEQGPSAKLVEYILNTAFRTKEEFEAKKCSPASFEKRYGDILNALLQVNQVDRFKREELSGKLIRFYDLLQKEKRILINNLHWLRFNSNQLCEIPPQIREQVLSNQENDGQ